MIINGVNEVSSLQPTSSRAWTDRLFEGLPLGGEKLDACIELKHSTF